MFTTFLKICTLAVISDCVEFTDKRGPYPTEKQCEARAYEMANDLKDLFTGPIDISYKCKRDLNGSNI